MIDNQFTQIERALLDIVEDIRISLENEPTDAHGEYIDPRAGDLEYKAASIQDLAVSVSRIKERS